MPDCARCHRSSTALIMSMFDTEMICLDCKAVEKQDPRYQEAEARELEECRRGNFNFEGIGRNKQ